MASGVLGMTPKLVNRKPEDVHISVFLKSTLCDLCRGKGHRPAITKALSFPFCDAGWPSLVLFLGLSCCCLVEREIFDNLHWNR